MAVAATVFVVVVPLLAFRLAGISMTPLPTEPEHLQEDIDPEPRPSAAVAHRRRRPVHDRPARRARAGISGALLPVARVDAWADTTLVLLVALACLLMLRPLTSGWHRLSLAVPAVTGAGALLFRVLAGADLPARLAGVALLLFAGVALVAVARVLPGRRIIPYWGRLGDIVQLIATVALLPVMLAVLGVYAELRALGG